jgi:16S rRNA (guanine966-N2)-methyltransferase
MATDNRIRIIGGRHRGRKLCFADLPGLRPTGDRMRETLFNWLQPLIAGARCLDLFAGSGALGLEAASRGAGEVVMVERARQVVRQLRENVELLGLENTEVVEADGIEWLSASARPFDIVFLDPPFADRLLPLSLRLLTARGWLAPGARVYLENDAGQRLPGLPEQLVLEKSKRMGQVAFGLAHWMPPATAGAILPPCEGA